MRASKRATRKTSHALMTKLCRRLVVEIRDQNKCQKCGSSGIKQSVHWAHIKNRKAKSLVFVPWASLALCAAHHFWFDSHKGSLARPGEGLQWWMDKFPDRALALKAWEHKRNKPKLDREIERLWLESELKRLLPREGR